MNLLLHFSPLSHGRVLACYAAIHLKIAHELMLGVAALGSLLLVISSLPGRKESWTRHRRIVGVAGALGLLSVTGSLYWYTYDLYSHSYWGIVRPSVVAYTLYVARRVLGGATIAMFVFVIFSKGVKVVLAISVTLFLVSELFAIIHNGYWGFATPLVALAMHGRLEWQFPPRSFSGWTKSPARAELENGAPRELRRAACANGLGQSLPTK
jgi:hypothetical protein